jgi:AcrR family transcriptional regulator
LTDAAIDNETKVGKLSQVTSDTLSDRQGVDDAASGREGADEAERRVLDGARASIARWGVERTSVDDVAREASVSRATVYRVFPGGKSAVIAALIDAESGHLRTLIASAERSTLTDTMSALVLTLANWLDNNDALRRVIEHEPGLIGPHLAFRGGDIVVAEIVEMVKPLMLGFVATDEVDGATDWLVRLLRSHLLQPSSYVALADPQSVQRFVRTFIVPALAGPSNNPSQHLGATS